MSYLRKYRMPSLIISILLLIGMIYLGVSYEISEIEADNNSKSNMAINKYQDYYYYDAGRSYRYEEYKAENHMLRIDEVIWQVNVDLDQEPYEYSQIIEKPDDPLVLVTKHNMLSISYEPEELVIISETETVSSKAAAAYNEMTASAEEEGIEFRVQSGYKSYAEQSETYNDGSNKDSQNVDSYVARPGFSEHQTGLAIDLNTLYGETAQDFAETKEANWLKENAHKYGFIIRYTKENSQVTQFDEDLRHIRYIGVEHSTKMYQRKIKSLEEYIVKNVWYKNE